MTLHLAATPESTFTPYGYLPAPEARPEKQPPPIKAGKGKNSDLYQSVTDSVIAQLEAGRVPWVQPWGRPDIAAPLGLPQNAQTGRNYSGVNILLLWGAAIDTQRTTQFWLTYKQAQSLGAQVRKGETGTTICYADTFIPKAEKQRAQENGTTAIPIGFLKRYTVFNADQCEGLDPSFFEGVAPMPERELIPRAEKLIAATGADFRTGGDRAFYSPSDDFIQVPPQPAFFEQINYYRTCFHELGHWTGHKSRLDRNLKGQKGTKLYAKEELCAEMTTAFICAALGITPTVRHADYIGSWLTVLKDDKRFVFKAASLASKAADFILAFETSQQAKPQALQVAA
jgi:antirestriction protein ArdC